MEYASYLQRESRTTSEILVVVWDGYLTISTKDHTHMLTTTDIAQPKASYLFYFITELLTMFDFD